MWVANYPPGSSEVMGDSITLQTLDKNLCPAALISRCTGTSEPPRSPVTTQIPEPHPQSVRFSRSGNGAWEFACLTGSHVMLTAAFLGPHSQTCPVKVTRGVWYKHQATASPPTPEMGSLAETEESVFLIKSPKWFGASRPRRLQSEKQWLPFRSGPVSWTPACLRA